MDPSVAGDWVVALVGSPWAFVVLWLLATLDGFFPPVPSETAVIALAAVSAATGRPEMWLVVVTAAVDAQAGWLPLQQEMATLSTNSSHRVVPYTHDALITDETAARTSSQAIRDVVHAVRFATSLK